MSTLHTWEYLGRVVAMLGHIRVANGYHTDAGLLVTREPAQSELDDPARIVVLLDSTRQSDNAAARCVGLQLVLAIVGQVPKTLDFAPGGEWPIPQFIESSVVPPAEGMNWIGAAARYTATVRLRTTPTTPIT